MGVGVGFISISSHLWSGPLLLYSTVVEETGYSGGFYRQGQCLIQLRLIIEIRYLTPWLRSHDTFALYIPILCIVKLCKNFFGTLYHRPSSFIFAQLFTR